MNRRCHLALTLLMVSTLSFADNIPTVSQCDKLIAAADNTTSLSKTFFNKNGAMIDACFNHCGTLYDADSVSTCKSSLGSLSFHGSIINTTNNIPQKTVVTENTPQPVKTSAPVNKITKETPPTANASIRWF